MWIMGGIHIQIGLPRGPLSICPNTTIQCFLPQRALCFSLLSMLHLYLHSFVGHNQVITFLRAAYRMTDFHWSKLFSAELLYEAQLHPSATIYVFIYLLVCLVRELIWLPLNEKRDTVFPTLVSTIKQPLPDSYCALDVFCWHGCDVW